MWNNILYAAVALAAQQHISGFIVYPKSRVKPVVKKMGHSWNGQEQYRIMVCKNSFTLNFGTIC